MLLRCHDQNEGTGLPVILHLLSSVALEGFQRALSRAGFFSYVRGWMDGMAGCICSRPDTLFFFFCFSYLYISRWTHGPLAKIHHQYALALRWQFLVMIDYLVPLRDYLYEHCDSFNPGRMTNYMLICFEKTVAVGFVVYSMPPPGSLGGGRRYIRRRSWARPHWWVISRWIRRRGGGADVEYGSAEALAGGSADLEPLTHRVRSWNTLQNTI